MAIRVTVNWSQALPVIVATVDSDTDVLAIRGVYGFNRHKSGMWFAPGFYPFGVWVIADLKEVSRTCTVTLDSNVSRLEAEYQGIVDNIFEGNLDGYTPVTKPYEHQVKALSQAIYTPRLGLFLDPGLGKTKIACDLMLYERTKRPGSKFLVVALRVNLKTWEREMLVHSGGNTRLLAIQATGGKEARAKKIEKAALDPECAGIVVTYDTCRVSEEQILSYPYTSVILDESHSLRGASSGRTKSVLRLVNKPGGTYRRVLLSGTPALGSPLHMWGQLKALGDFVVGNYWQFVDKFCVRSPYNKHIITGYKNLGELNDTVTALSLRKTAEECLDLPDRVIQIIEVDADSKTRTAYNSCIRQLREAKTQPTARTTIGGIDFGVPDNTLTLLTRLSQIAMGFAYKSRTDPKICDSCPKLAKCVDNDIKPYTRACSVVTTHPGNDTALVGTTDVLDAVLELVDAHLQAGKKVIVWARHRWVLDTLNLEITKLVGTSYKVYRYDSSTTDPSAVELGFNADADPAVIVAQISMGIGVTFKAPVMVYAEVSWALDHWLQSMDRNYGLRAAGMGKLLVQAVVLKDSVAHSTLELLRNKIDVSSLISKRVECATCKMVGDCLAKAIEPFDAGCILDKKNGSKTSVTIKEL